MNNKNNTNTPSPNTNVYGYIRVSTSTQVHDGQGLETQENEIIKYCEANSLNLIHIFSDKGISGAMGDEDDDLSKRQGMSELLDTLDDECKTIIVLNKSRLWRNDTARVYISRQVRSIKGNILSIEEPRYSLYTKDPNEFLFNSFMEMLDEYSRLEINMKLSKGRRTKANKGIKPCGNLPYGYRYSSDKKKIEINPEESKIVNIMFELASQGNGYQDIANKLNDQGYTTKKGNQWNRKTIYTMLHNDFYISVLTYTEKIKGSHPAIIDMDTWMKVNDEYEMVI